MMGRENPSDGLSYDRGLDDISVVFLVSLRGMVECEREPSPTPCGTPLHLMSLAEMPILITSPSFRDTSTFGPPVSALFTDVFNEDPTSCEDAARSSHGRGKEGRRGILSPARPGDGASADGTPLSPRGRLPKLRRQPRVCCLAALIVPGG